MRSPAYFAALAAVLVMSGCQRAPDEAADGGRLGFIGATTTPSQMTMSPAGCAASYLFDAMVADIRGEQITHRPPGGVYAPGTNYVTEGPPKAGALQATGVFTAPPSLAGKPITITIRGFIAGVGGTTRASFAGQQSETWTDSATADEPSMAITHEFVAPAVAGENRFELHIGLPVEGNDPANANFGIETVDFRVGDVEGCGPDIERFTADNPRPS